MKDEVQWSSLEDVILEKKFDAYRYMSDFIESFNQNVLQARINTKKQFEMDENCQPRMSADNTTRPNLQQSV